MNGLATVPTLNTAFSRQGMDIFFKQFFVICAAAMLLIPAILTESKVLITIVSLTIDLLFPASIILLAMTRRIIPALTPSLMKSVVLILGSRYLLLFAFLFILSQGPTITLGLLSSYESAVTMPLVILLFCYFWLVMARLIGYTVFQHQGRFGFTSDDKEDKRTLTTDELVDVEFRQAQAAVEIFIKDGDFDSALALLRYKLETVPSDLVLEEYHHRLLMAMRNFTAVLSNSDNRIHRFQQSKRPDLAAIVYADCLKINPGYRPKKLTVAIKLAERMYANLEINGALKLLVGAHKNYPADQNIALAYMLAAEIYINSKQDKVKSQSLLKYVKRNFPQFPSKSRIEALETSLAV
ncbi:MAG: hypothetical protein KUG79_00270 [Pseudomonadales bacterium]|nr:hypothetical protein [Pseudomonadales bacterium]